VDNLLLVDFIQHYRLNITTPVIISDSTNARYFELKDDNHLIYYNKNEGTAAYINNSDYRLKVVNYEAFIKNLPQAFKQNRGVCDLIVFTTEKLKYFLLNELTDTLPQYVVDFTSTSGARIGKRKKAISQLLSTLETLIAVLSIKSFINTFAVRECIFFNKQATPPQTTNGFTITATASFNRVNMLTQNGFKMSYPDIEELGFELIEYSGLKPVTIV